MKLNLSIIRRKLSSGSTSLVEKTHLNSDMRSLYNYYEEEGEINPFFDSYRNDHETFELKPFSESYLSALLGRKIRVDEEDGRVRIH